MKNMKFFSNSSKRTCIAVSGIEDNNHLREQRDFQVNL